MEGVAIALVELIGTFPMPFQMAVVLLILIGGLLFLGKSFLTAIRGTKFDMPAKKKRKRK